MVIKYPSEQTCERGTIFTEFSTIPAQIVDSM